MIYLGGVIIRIGPLTTLNYTIPTRFANWNLTTPAARIQSPPCKVLLTQKGLVAGYKNVKAVFFGCPEQFAVPQLAPAHVRRGYDFVLADGAEFGSQLVRQIVIEKNPHGARWTRCE